MRVHIGERVYWGAPEVIYLEGSVKALNVQAATARVRIERATQNAAHLIGLVLVFACDGLMLLRGESPPDLVDQQAPARQSTQPMSDDEKIHGAAAALVYQKYGSNLSEEQRRDAVTQVITFLESDPALRTRIILSMDLIQTRES